jgi:uncharacterized protein YijF (DUF1287 family)
MRYLNRGSEYDAGDEASRPCIADDQPRDAQSRQLPRVPAQGDGRLGVASAVLGVLVPFTLLLTAIPALVTGFICLKRKRSGKSAAIAGVVLGGVGTVLLILVVVTLAGLTNPQLDWAAVSQGLHPVRYNAEYIPIPYPGGDVPNSIGCCADVIVRAYRKLNVDLQKEIHEDILRAPREYGITRPDPNIDHRRVANLRVFFRRQGAAVPVTQRAVDYRDGDIVTWMVPSTEPGLVVGHIGFVVTPVVPMLGRPLVCHNINGGPYIADVLFRYRITGHYR